MIVFDRMYIKTRWLEFPHAYHQNDMLVELVVYEKRMLKCTVRHQWNFVSRFRPLPDYLTPYSVHGQINYTTLYTNMLAYYPARIMLYSHSGTKYTHRYPL